MTLGTVLATDPGPCAWELPDPAQADAGIDLIGIGADLAPSTLLQAYRTGLFPMESQGSSVGGHQTPAEFSRCANCECHDPCAVLLVCTRSASILPSRK